MGTRINHILIKRDPPVCEVVVTFIDHNVFVMNRMRFTPVL